MVSQLAEHALSLAKISELLYLVNRQVIVYKHANIMQHKMSQLMRLWYLSHRRPAKRAFAVRSHEVWK